MTRLVSTLIQDLLVFARTMRVVTVKWPGWWVQKLIRFASLTVYLQLRQWQLLTALEPLIWFYDSSTWLSWWVHIYKICHLLPGQWSVTVVTVKVTMAVTLVQLQSTTDTVIVAVFVTVTFVAVRAKKKKQTLYQCIHQFGHNKAKLEVETSQNSVNISVVTVTVTVNVNLTVTVTPTTIFNYCT